MIFTNINFYQMAENDKKYQDSLDIVYARISDFGNCGIGHACRGRTGKCPHNSEIGS
ncbi:MAG: hypothetical protein HYR68_04660 [Burkholderiales bacterium]|nr:hypothetical protein [Burkholderiales bacterium]